MPKLTVHHRRRKRKARVFQVSSGEGRYLVMEIPKKGGVRRVYIPADYLKRRLKEIARNLAEAIDAGLHPGVHGFRPGRSVLTQARQHVGYAWTLSLDLKDCFDHVTYDAVHNGWRVMAKRVRNLKYLAPAKDSITYGFIEHAARQGLPTSPVYCNIALTPLDYAIAARWPGVVYTRYADDLNFSANDRAVLEEIRRELPALVEAEGFEVHPKKWHLQWSRFGRRVICGVAVDDKGIHPTRRQRRKLRAWQHRRPKSRRTRGLARWCSGVRNHETNTLWKALGGSRCPPTRT